MFNMKYQSQPVTGCVLFGSLVINPLAATIPHYSFNKTKQHTHTRKKTPEGQTWLERHQNVEECSPSARPSLAAPMAAPPASHACRAMREVQMHPTGCSARATVGIQEPSSRLFAQGA